MPLPKGPNPGGLPQRPGGGLPVPPGGGLPNPAQRPNQAQLPSQRPNAIPQPRQEQPAPALPTPPEPKLSGMDRLSEYDFGAREVDTEALGKNLRDAEPEIPDFDFDLPSDDEDERLREVAERRERETAARFDRSMEEREPAGRVKNNVLKPQAGELDEKGQNVFIDKENKKVQPFGGKKSAIKVNDLDRRKNMRRNALIVQVVMIGLVLVTLGFAAKNAFFPPQGLTEESVQQIVYNSTGTTAFPLEQGSAFAVSFMEAYLEYSPDDPTSSSIIQYYTKGALSPGNGPDGVMVGKNFKQTVVNGPFIYKSQPSTDRSAIYTVGALVKVESLVESQEGGTAQGNGSTSNASSGSLVWKYFTVNVYYDPDTMSFAITESPTVTAVPEAMKSSEVPKSVTIGTGKAVGNEVMASITPTIYGFLSAYRESSPTNYDQLLPFLGAEPAENLLTGLDGVYDFKGGKANEGSVKISAFGTDSTMIKAVITVTWVQNVAGSFVETQSNYIMDIQPISGGYDVTRFVPLAYFPGN